LLGAGTLGKKKKRHRGEDHWKRGGRFNPVLEYNGVSGGKIRRGTSEPAPKERGRPHDLVRSCISEKERKKRNDQRTDTVLV